MIAYNTHPPYPHHHVHRQIPRWCALIWSWSAWDSSESQTVSVCKKLSFSVKWCCCDHVIFSGFSPGAVRVPLLLFSGWLRVNRITLHHIDVFPHIISRQAGSTSLHILSIIIDTLILQPLSFTKIPMGKLGEFSFFGPLKVHHPSGHGTLGCIFPSGPSNLCGISFSPWNLGKIEAFFWRAYFFK